MHAYILLGILYTCMHTQSHIEIYIIQLNYGITVSMKQYTEANLQKLDVTYLTSQPYESHIVGMACRLAIPRVLTTGESTVIKTNNCGGGHEGLASKPANKYVTWL